MKHHLLILTEGSATLGLGHITRCTALAQSAQEAGFEAHFLIHGDTSALNACVGFPAQLLNWHQHHLPDDLLTLHTVALIDSYLADVTRYQHIASRASLLVCLDDFNRIPYPPGALIVNGTFGADNWPTTTTDAIRLYGPRYIPLRRPFWDVPSRAPAEKIRSVLVLFGGEDLRGLTLTISNLLVKNFPHWEIHPVFGAAYRGPQPHPNPRLKPHFNLPAETMRDLMLSCDLAISAAGQTLYELARCGCPTIAIQVADNQTNNIRGARALGIIPDGLSWDAPDLNDQILAKLHTMTEPAVRRNISQLMQSTVDGQGARRVIAEIKKRVV